MPPTNRDVVGLIATYSDPDPVLYTRLAMVNRDFYHVYTSDKLWAKLDCYNQKQDIFAHFVEKSKGSERLLVYCWWSNRDHRLCDQPTPMFFPRPFLLCERLDADKIDNKYARLGFYHRSGGYMRAEQGFPINDRQLFLLLLEPERFWLPGSNLLGNEEVMMKAAYFSCVYYQYFKLWLPGARVLRRVVDQAANGGATPLAHGVGDAALNSELVEYALARNPRVVSNWLRTRLSMRLPTQWARDLNRKALLSVVRGVPQALWLFPDLWNDREFCLAVFEYVDGDFYSVAPEFLRQCRDDEIVAKALSNFGYSICFVQKQYVSDPKFSDLAIEALCRATAHTSPRPPSNSEEWIKLVKWNPTSFSRAIDQGILTYESIKSFGTLKVLDDHDWVADRIYFRPELWNLASARLKQNQRLLELAFESDMRVRTNFRVTGSLSAPFEMEMFPSRYHHEHEIVVRAAACGAIPNVPYHRLTREMVKAHIDSQKTLRGLDLSGPKFQDLVFEAVLEDITLLFSNPAAERLVKDAVMWAKITSGRKYLYTVGGQRCVVEAGKPARIIDKSLAKKLVDRLPGVFILRVANPDPPRQDGKGAYREEMLEALKSNGHLFNNLANEQRYSKEFQQAIGTLFTALPQQWRPIRQTQLDMNQVLVL